jgi:predicted CopG family antitoxin
MPSTTVKVSAETYAKLKEAVAETGESMIEVLAKAVEAYRRQTFLEGINADFAALRNNRQAWAEEQAERTAWDETMADDLQGD